MPQEREPRRNNRRRPQTEAAILDGALKIFGEKGFESATISAICKAAGVSDATLYEYFGSKEEVLFSIAELHTRREYERMQAIAHYVHPPRERMRLIIQGYLEFYENNRLYTSVALLTLKGNRRFINSSQYATIRESAQTVVQVYREGVEAGVFREELDPYLVRNMVLGFIEHLTIQWLLLDRPKQLSDKRDIIFEMLMRAVEKSDVRPTLELTVRASDGTLPIIASGND